MKVLSYFKKTYFLLLLIVAIAAFFRFYNFPNNPPSLNWDEVSMGYNAHSILTTGRDEYGQYMPIYFRSLDDFKPPVTIYMVALSEYVFGYNDFAVRFPTALAGVGTVVVLFFLTYQLTKSRTISLLSSLILAILPWHVEFSRFALEANIALFFLSLATLIFILSLRNIKLLPLSAIIFSLTTYTYWSFRVVVPLFVVLLFFMYRKKINLKKAPVMISILILIISLFVLVRDSTQTHVNTRLQGLSVLNNVDEFNHEIKQMQYEGSLGINLPRRFFHEMPLFTNAKLVTRGYLTHFSPDFLFFDYGQRAHVIPSVGLLYIWMAFFISIGVYFLVKKYPTNTKLIVLSLLIIAPIPAAVTYNVPNEIRTIAIIVPFVLLSSIGIYEFFLWSVRKNWLVCFLLLITFVLFASVQAWNFFRQYQIHLPHEASSEWQYGRKELAAYLEKNKKKYDRIQIAQDLHSPYIFMLYYTKYDPKKYLKEGGTLSGGFAFEGNRFDKYLFRRFNFEKDIIPKNDLYVGKPTDFPPGTKLLHIIKYLDGEEAMHIVESQEVKRVLEQKGELSPLLVR